MQQGFTARAPPTCRSSSSFAKPSCRCAPAMQQQRMACLQKASDTPTLLGAVRRWQVPLHHPRIRRVLFCVLGPYGVVRKLHALDS